MSVNYYLDSPDNDEGHLGKWSADRFLGYAPEGVNSFEDWAKRLEGHRIFAEHGIEYTPEQMGEIAKERGPMARFAPHYGYDNPSYFTDQGVQFARHQFC